MQKKYGLYARKMLALFVTLVVVLGIQTGSMGVSIEQTQVQAAPMSRSVQTANGMVRVYLASLGNPSTLNLTINGKYSLGGRGEVFSNGQALTVLFSPASGSLRLSYGGQTLDMGRRFSLRRHSTSGENGIKIRQARESQNPYPGDLSFEVVGGAAGYTLYTIAHIYIEDYLYGVLPYEMGNSSGIEALKAQAVAARTYTVRMMQNRASGLYDVKDTTSDQVYRGTPSGNANCVSAVDATKGIVLKYGSSYITTFYSSSNGGQTEVSRSGTSYPYMTVKDDPFDYANPNSTVKEKTIYADLSSPLNPSALISLLKTKVITQLNRSGFAATSTNTSLQTIKSITPHTPQYAAPSRLYTQMDFEILVSTQNAAGLSITVAQRVTCDIFDELESILSLGIQSLDNELWSVEENGSSFTLQARRYGHGMGMSQRGAMYMAKLGYTYDQVLGFYYDGCTRVKHSFTQSILDGSSGDEQITVVPPVYDDVADSSACSGMVQLPSAGSVLAIRNEKAETAAVIGTVSNGALVEVLSANGAWCFIKFGELKGYIPASAVSFSGTPCGTETDATSILGFATVTANDFVNLRSGPGMNAKILGSAPAGAVLTVFDQNNGWARVQYNALSAYASMNFLSAVSTRYPSGQSLSEGKTTTIIATEDNSGYIDVLETPSMSAQSVGQIPSGTMVTLISNDGSWARVNWQGITGYILSSLLKDHGESVPEGSDEEANEEVNAPWHAIVTTQSGSLNMRTFPQAGSRILTTIPKGMRIDVTEREADWSCVWYNGMTGYVMSRFLTFTEGEGTTSPPETSFDSLSQAVVVTPGGSLNLRVLPRAGSQILTTIPQGVRVNIDEYGDEWCRVYYAGYSGYVMTAFLSFDGSEENDASPSGVYAEVTTVTGSLNLRERPDTYAAVLYQLPQHVHVNVLEYGSNWSRISYHGMTGYVMTRYLTILAEKDEDSNGTTPDQGTTIEPISKAAYVSTPSGALNLREYPGEDSRVLTSIPQGVRIEVLSYGADWCSVSYDAYSGFVMTRFLRFTSAEWENDPETETTPPVVDDFDEGDAVAVWVMTEEGTLNLRSQATTASEILADIPRGTMVKMLMEGNEWSLISFNGLRGYVMTQYLTAYQPTLPDEWNDEPDGIDGNGEYALDPTLKAPTNPMYAVLYSPNETPLWASCNEYSSALAWVPSGAEVEILLRGQNWSCVAWENVQGYCKNDMLSVIGE